MLQLNSIRLADYNFTLSTAADEFNVSKELMHMLLLSIYEQLGALDFEKQVEIKKINPAFPQKLTCNKWLNKCFDEALNEDLLEKVYHGYTLTDKAIKIFEKASEIQNHLDTESYYCEPCYSLMNFNIKFN